MKNLKFLVNVFLAIVIFNFSACSSENGDSPSEVVKESYKLLKNKNYEKLAKLYVTADGKKLTQDEEKKVEGLLGMAYSQNEEKGGVENVVIDNEEIMEDGNKAKVKYTVTFGNGNTDTETATLFKIDGKWYLSV